MKNRYISINSNDYKRQAINYKKNITVLKKENSLYNQRKKFTQTKTNYDTSIIKDPFQALLHEEIITETEEKNPIIKLIKELDQNRMITFDEEHSINFEPNLSYIEYFLYHGLRHKNKLETLESILKERKILSGKHLDNYFHYSDNCNDGEYVSLARYSNSLEFQTFVSENICLVISPLCHAYKTVYVPFDTWNYIKKNNISVKNRYSYSEIEYQVKDFIPIEMIRAIGIPYISIMLSKGIEEADKLKQDIIDLLNKYNINLPIIDVNYYNKIIYPPHKNKTKILEPKI